jgi:hypothetical protein
VTHKQHLRNVYRKALREAKSSRVGCRHYVPGFLHRVIDPDETMVIDPKEGDVDIRVAVQVLSPSGKRKLRAAAEDSGRWGRKRLPVSLSRESVLHVRYLPKLGVGVEKLLNDIRDHSRDVTTDRKDVGVRVGLGDRGNMHPVGTRIMLDKVKRQRYAASSKKCWQGPLRRSIVAAAKVASAVVPGILRIIQDAERDGGISPPVGGMSGDEAAFCYVSHSMDISVDLANSSHYDSNDASLGFTIWTEDVPGSTKNWYFVLPNVYGKWPLGMRAGKKSLTYQGVAIKLTHGTMISWDGRVIRHATSVVDEAEVDNGDKLNHRYGNFFAAKSSIVAFGARMALMKKLEEVIRRCRVKVDREGEAANEVGPLDAPIPRKGKEIVEGDVARCEDDEGDYVADADADDGGRSWCGHSYASGSGDDDDHDHMSISDDGGELLEGACCDVDDDDDNLGSVPVDDDDDNLGSVPVEVGVLDVSVGLGRTLVGNHNDVSIPDVSIPVEVGVSLPVEVGVSLPVRVKVRDVPFLPDATSARHHKNDSHPVEVGVPDVLVRWDESRCHDGDWRHDNRGVCADGGGGMQRVDCGGSQVFWHEWRHGDRDARDGGVGMRCEDRRGCPDYWLNGGDLRRRNDGQSSGNDGFAWRGGGCRPDPCARDWSQHSGGDDRGGRCQKFWPPGRGREWRRGDRDARDGGVSMRREDRRGCPDYRPNGGDLHRLNGGQSSGNDGFAWRGGGRRPGPCAHDWSQHSGGDGRVRRRNHRDEWGGEARRECPPNSFPTGRHSPRNGCGLPSKRPYDHFQHGEMAHGTRGSDDDLWGERRVRQHLVREQP